MNSKINVELKGVPKTLLLPLLGRAKLSEKSYSPIQDRRAKQLLESLNYDFDNLSKNVGHSVLIWMARAYHFDQAIRSFIKEYPEGVVVNLGAGLETAFFRVDNQRLTWIDLDLPEVIELRKKLIPAPPRVHYIPKSVLDFSWMDEVKQYGKNFFFFAGGFFMYFTTEQVKEIFKQLATHFPNNELIFDTISARYLDRANEMLKKANMQGALLQWGIDDGKELEKWSDQIKLIKQIPYYQDLKNDAKFPFLIRLKMFFMDMFSKNNIVQIKFI